MYVCSADLRFSHSVWLSGAKRGTIGMDVLNDEIRVAYLDPADASEAINMAQLEWVPCMKWECLKIRGAQTHLFLAKKERFGAPSYGTPILRHSQIKFAKTQSNRNNMWLLQVLVPISPTCHTTVS